MGLGNLTLQLNWRHKLRPDQITGRVYNEILCLIRIALELKEEDVARIFQKGGRTVSRSENKGYIVSKNHKNYRPLYYDTLIQFLKGLLIERRGEGFASPRIPTSSWE